MSLENTTKRSIRKGEKNWIKETEDGSISTQSLKDLRNNQNSLCYLCECSLNQLEPKHVHLDHIEPLSKGGAHVLSNVAWSCAECNLAKGTKSVEEFKKEQNVVLY